MFSGPLVDVFRRRTMSSGSRDAFAIASFLSALLAVLLISSLAFVAGCTPGSGIQDASEETPACVGTEWLRDCAKQTGVPMCVVRNGEATVVVAAGEGSTKLEIELSEASNEAFRRVGKFGISPIGDFEDWDAEPAQRRYAFNSLLSCLADTPSLSNVLELVPEQFRKANELDFKTSEYDKHIELRKPWLLLGAAATMLIAVYWGCPLRFWWTRLRRMGWSKWVRDALTVRGPIGLCVMLSLAAVTFFLRLSLVPLNYFHQIGVGPGYILMALHGNSLPYGSGYAELFGWISNLNAFEADRNVFLAMAIASSMIPVFGWIIARQSGASCLVAWTIAVLTAVHPLLARLAHSELYMAVQLVLLTAAGAALAWAGRTRTQSVRFWLSVLAAGLLVSQAARVHPTSWVPAATVPFVLIIQPGYIFKRIRRTFLATLGIATTVVATSLAGMLRVYFGELGHNYRFARLGVLIVACSGILAITAIRRLMSKSRCLPYASLHARITMIVAMATVCFAFATSWAGFQREPLFSDVCYLQTYPALLAVGITCIGILQRRYRAFCTHPRQKPKWWSAPLVIILLATTTGLWRWELHTTVPTDAQEQAWVATWRGKIPPNSVIAYLMSSPHPAGHYTLQLPIFGYNRVKLIELVIGDPNTGLSLSRLEPGTYYYRSSLCSTVVGKAICGVIENNSILEPIFEMNLPSIPSVYNAPLGPAPIRVGLYLVKDAEP